MAIPTGSIENFIRPSIKSTSDAANDFNKTEEPVVTAQVDHLPNDPASKASRFLERHNLSATLLDDAVRFLGSHGEDARYVVEVIERGADDKELNSTPSKKKSFAPLRFVSNAATGFAKSVVVLVTGGVAYDAIAGSGATKAGVIKVVVRDLETGRCFTPLQASTDDVAVQWHTDQLNDLHRKELFLAYLAERKMLEETTPKNSLKPTQEFMQQLGR